MLVVSVIKNSNSRNSVNNHPNLSNRVKAHSQPACDVVQINNHSSKISFQASVVEKLPEATQFMAKIIELSNGSGHLKEIKFTPNLFDGCTVPEEFSGQQVTKEFAKKMYNKFGHLAYWDYQPGDKKEIMAVVLKNYRNEARWHQDSYYKTNNAQAILNHVDGITKHFNFVKEMIEALSTKQLT